MARIEPLSNVKPIWDHEFGYPDRVRLAMADGTIQTFWLEVKQPRPQTEYIGKHLKKTGDVASSAGQAQGNKR